MPSSSYFARIESSSASPTIASTVAACSPPITGCGRSATSRAGAAVRAAAHRVVAGAERAADDDGELRHRGVRHRRHELRAVARDAAGLVLLADHEAGDVLQEDERHAPLAAELDEVRALLRRLGEEHAVVGEDPDRDALDAREPADERLAVQLLELVEARAVDDARDQLARVDLVADVVRDQPVELGGVERRRLRSRAVGGGAAELECSGPHDPAGDRERVLVGGGVVVGDAGAARVHVGAAELFRGHFLRRSRPSRAAARR